MKSTGNKSGPCPSCGAMGAVPDGVYTVLRDLGALRDKNPKVVDELVALRDTLGRVGDRVQDLEGVIRTTAPTAAPALLRLLRDPAMAAAIGIVGVLLGVLSFVLNSG